MSTHLITGVEGQDGVLLARHLLTLGHRVIGTSHNPEHSPEGRAETPVGAPLPPAVEVHRLDITDQAAFLALLDRHRPDAVHNLAGQSSVSQSWHDPELSRQVNEHAVVGLLEVMTAHPATRFIQASSAEIFGDAPGPAADESTPMAPNSPYAEAKAAAHRAVQTARESGLLTSNMVLFGHTSELQSTRFALAGMCLQAAEVGRGDRTQVQVQDPAVRRDWGSARDHVRAFALAAEAEPGDFVIGTGSLTRLGDVIAWALQAAGVPEAPVRVLGSDRPRDHDGLVADSTRARSTLSWSPEVALRSEIERMVRARSAENRT